MLPTLFYFQMKGRALRLAFFNLCHSPDAPDNIKTNVMDKTTYCQGIFSKK